VSPSVTVIIPTYNWSEALRVSIASALAQTYRDFELLVIGDCCTDDSREVALSFGDSRIRWHNLATRYKCQTGPNNYGISIATGSLIAYLGHDDVWHPGHLGSLVAKMNDTGADIACAVTVMYGPPGSGVRGLSGIFVGGSHWMDDFVPPSSIMHRRSLIDRIGPWRHPEELSDPVDCDLLRRAFNAGARPRSTDRLTVFKFNSAWRRDSYLRRDAAEQRRMLDRLTADPERCAEEEWAGLLRAVREKRLIESRMPDAGAVPPGHYYHEFMRNRGLEDAEVCELTETRRFSIEDQTSALDWHAVEPSEKWGPYRWSGPSPIAVCALPVRVPPRFRLRLQVLNWLPADIAGEVKLAVAGRPVAFTCREDGAPAVLLEAVVSLAEAPAGPLRVQIEVARLRCPFFETGGASPDQRWLGVCVSWIELEPLPLEDAAVSG
jgi:glycosyltransferase involved in cell wall biosynthesis